MQAPQSSRQIALAERVRELTLAALAVVERIADRVAVMHQGKIVETGDTERVLDHAEHPYTRRLLAAARGGI